MNSRDIRGPNESYLFIPNLHSWYIIMTEQDIWCLVTFFHYVTKKSTTVILLLSDIHSCTHSGLGSSSIDATATMGGSPHTSFSLTQQGQPLIKFTSIMQLSILCALAYIPFSTSTGYFHWSRLTFTYALLTIIVCWLNEVVSPRSYKVPLAYTISQL